MKKELLIASVLALSLSGCGRTDTGTSNEEGAQSEAPAEQATPPANEPATPPADQGMQPTPEGKSNTGDSGEVIAPPDQAPAAGGGTPAGE